MRPAGWCPQTPTVPDACRLAIIGLLALALAGGTCATSPSAVRHDASPRAVTATATPASRGRDFTVTTSSPSVHVSRSVAPTPVPTATPRRSATVTPRPTASPRPDTPTPAPTPRTYVIQAGDTLRAIAERFNTTIDRLVELNAIENPDLIRTGATLRIESPARPTAARREPATVMRVIDGDTIEVVLWSTQRLETVRYIGIDTPETVHPSRPVEPLGPEATQANRALVDGNAVTLERDVTNRDRYGRLLRYVYVEANGQNLLVNAELVRRGLAHSSPYPPDVTYQASIARAEAEAKRAGRGLWAQATPAARPTVARPPVRTATPTSTRSCHASYPSVCIPPPPPDLDCGEIPHRRFPVVGSDPHRFDGDRDGVGCER